MKLTNKLVQIIEQEKDSLLLWIPVFFGFGAAFYFSCEANFFSHFFLFICLFFSAIFLSFLNRHSFKFLIFLCCVLFLSGIFYANFYQKIFLNYTKITGKIYLDVEGKIAAIKNFTNSQNHLSGMVLTISKPILKRAEFVKKTKFSTRVENSKKTLINLKDFQKIDREFLDYSKNYQQVEWVKKGDLEIFPKPPPKISVTLTKGISKEISVNDKISARLLLQPLKDKEFLDDFDFKFSANSKKIGAFAFVLGDVEILEKDEVSNFDQWFLSLREKIRSKIFKNLQGDDAAIATAFLIGERKQISGSLVEDIRNSGLAHLFAISGFHLSLAAAIFFISTRFLLSRSQYLALNFDLKKISAVTAIFAAYFYLEIANSPVTAKRAFLMIAFALLALFFNERLNAKRAAMAAALLLILFNPYLIFSISFQLSFVAILTLIACDENLKKHQTQNYFSKIFFYFYKIILISFAIQIATLPFLIHAFKNFAALGFIANVVAIPIASIFVMPLGFLSLLLMPLNLEKYSLLLMQKGIILIKKTAIFTANLDYSHFAFSQFANFGLLIATIGFLLFCLCKSRVKFVGLALFFLSFFSVFLVNKPDILFDSKQKFFAIHNEKDGLVFSKKLRPSKQREKWMNYMNESEFKWLGDFSNDWQKQRGIFCSKQNCQIRGSKSFLILRKRHKISELCEKNFINQFDVIVNLTAKYKLPSCISDSKTTIDNLDFYHKGGHFFYFDGDDLLIKTAR